MTTITGNTYPVRSALKSLGGKWNRRAQGWDVPAENVEQARALVENAPAGSNDGVPYRKYRSNLFVLSSGAELYQNKTGRCEDAPCCGCCNF